MPHGLLSPDSHWRINSGCSSVGEAVCANDHQPGWMLIPARVAASRKCFSRRTANGALLKRNVVTFLKPRASRWDSARLAIRDSSRQTEAIPSELRSELTETETKCRLAKGHGPAMDQVHPALDFVNGVGMNQAFPGLVVLAKSAGGSGGQTKIDQEITVTVKPAGGASGDKPAEKAEEAAK